MINSPFEIYVLSILEATFDLERTMERQDERLRLAGRYSQVGFDRSKSFPPILHTLEACRCLDYDFCTVSLRRVASGFL